MLEERLGALRSSRNRGGSSRSRSCEIPPTEFVEQAQFTDDVQLCDCEVFRWNVESHEGDYRLVDMFNSCVESWR